MKLRFKGNTLRLRLNQTEVRSLAAGRMVEERINFPGGAALSYVLGRGNGQPSASFASGVIRVDAPESAINAWATTEEIGMYFEVPANEKPLRIAIEKDLECIDGPIEERDPDAFPRAAGSSC